MGNTYQFAGTERFEIVRRIGAGGMGVVYEALDADRGARVAIKTLLRADGEALLRFKREFRSLRDMHHPNLVTLFELIESSGEWFFTMEMVDGVDFLSYVWNADARALRNQLGAALAPTLPRAPGPGTSAPNRRLAVAPDLDRLRAVAPQFALGLAALHDAGKIHRDIKPSNVMVNEQGRVVILDLGLVAEQDSEARSSSGQVLGTAAYMAPEQATGRSPGASADWYSFGTVLYEALTGSLPFDGAPFEILLAKQDRDPVPAHELAPEVPDDLDRLCVELLRRNPDARPTGAEVMRRLGVRPQMVELVSAPSILSAPRFVGRERELAELMAAYETTSIDHAVGVIVHGESGVGKTALIRELVLQVGDTAGGGRRPLVLSGRCFDNESVRYNAFDGVIDLLSQHLRRLPAAEAGAILPRHSALLVRAFPVLAQVEAMASVPLWRGESADPDELRTKMLAAVRDLFALLAERAPVIITIDDLQWANRDSMLLLRELLRPPEAPPVLLLASWRPDTGAGDPNVAPDVELPGDVRTIPLSALSPEAARELTAVLLAGVGLPIDRAPAIAAEAGGHPLHIDALVRHAAVSGDDDAVPQLDQAILARVAQLDADARRVIEMVCIAGAPLPRGVVARAAELEEDGCARALGLLRLHNLVRASGARQADAVEPYHDRVRESVAAAVSDADRLRYHSRLAVVLEASGADAQLLMRHQEAAGDEERAAVTALRAAHEADEALAYDRAAELYRAALRLGAHEAPARRDIVWRLSDALASAGRGAEAAPMYVEAATGADPATMLEGYRRAAEQYLVTGHLEQGMETLRTLLGEIGAGYPATQGRAMASLLWTRALLRLRGVRWKPRDASTIGRERLTRVDVFRSVAQGMGMVDNIRGAAFQSRGLLMALRAGEPSRIGRALSLESVFLATQGARGTRRARVLLDKIGSLSEGDPYIKAWHLSATGVIFYFEGNFAGCSEILAEAEKLWRAQTVGTLWEKNNVRVFRLLSLRFRGIMTEMGPLADDAIRYALRKGDRFLETTVRRHSDLLWLCADDADAARASLDAATWVPLGEDFHIQHWYELEALGELALYEGRGAEELTKLEPRFAALDRSLLMRVQTVRVMAWFIAGRLLLVRGGADDVRRAARLARKLCRERIGYSEVLGNLLRGVVDHLGGRSEASVTALERAMVLAGESDLRLIGGSIDRAMGTLRGGDAGTTQIAAADRGLAALGVRRPAAIARVFVPRIFDEAG